MKRRNEFRGCMPLLLLVMFGIVFWPSHLWRWDVLAILIVVPVGGFGIAALLGAMLDYCDLKRKLARLNEPCVWSHCDGDLFRHTNCGMVMRRKEYWMEFCPRCRRPIKEEWRPRDVDQSE